MAADYAQELDRSSVQHGKLVLGKEAPPRRQPSERVCRCAGTEASPFTIVHPQFGDFSSKSSSEIKRFEKGTMHSCDLSYPVEHALSSVSSAFALSILRALWRCNNREGNTAV